MTAANPAVVHADEELRFPLRRSRYAWDKKLLELESIERLEILSNTINSARVSWEG